MHDHLPIGCGEVRFSSLKSEKLVAIKEKKNKIILIDFKSRCEFNYNIILQICLYKHSIIYL